MNRYRTESRIRKAPQCCTGKSLLLALFALFVFVLLSFGTALADGVQSPVFSHPAGFYDDEFLLTLSSPEGCDIYYTTDCTSPFTSSTALKYTEEILIYNNNTDEPVISTITGISLKGEDAPSGMIDKGIIIRAACRSKNGRWSEEVINSFFVGKTRKSYTTMGVISLVTNKENLFDEDLGIYMIGNRYREWVKSEDYEPYESLQDSKNPTNYNQKGKAWERPCFIQVFNKGEAEFEQNVGMRIAGAYSRAEQQKSITLYARKEYSPNESKMRYDFFAGNCRDVNGELIASFDKVTLRNGGNDIFIARFRDDLNARLFEPLNVSVLTKADYVLFINGEFWGYYSLQEKPENTYVAAHFGLKKSEVTVIKNGEVEGNESVAEAWQAYWERAIRADFTDQAVYDEFCDRVDIDSFIDYFIAESYICNWDFGININNWMMWRSDTRGESEWADGKWRFIVYDTEYSVGMYYDERTSSEYHYLDNMNRDEVPLSLTELFYKLSENAQFLNRFYERYLYVVENYFAREKVSLLITERIAAIEEVFLQTCYRFGKTTDLDWEETRVRSFFNERPYYALVCVAEYCGVDNEETRKDLQYGLEEWKMRTGGDMAAEMESTQNSFTAHVYTAGLQDWQAQVVNDISLKKGYEYVVSFSGSGTQGLPFAVSVQRQYGDYKTYFFEKMELTENRRDYSISFVSPQTCENAGICFKLGEHKGEYTFENITITVRPASLPSAPSNTMYRVLPLNAAMNIISASNTNTFYRQGYDAFTLILQRAPIVALMLTVLLIFSMISAFAGKECMCRKLGMKKWQLAVPFAGQLWLQKSLYRDKKFSLVRGLFFVGILLVVSALVLYLKQRSLSLPFLIAGGTGILLYGIYAFCMKCRMCRVFGRSRVFALGLFLLPAVFYPILVFTFEPEEKCESETEAVFKDNGEEASASEGEHEQTETQL